MRWFWPLLFIAVSSYLVTDAVSAVVAATEGMTVRQIERRVAGASSTGPNQTMKIRLDVPPEVYALWLDATKPPRTGAKSFPGFTTG